jgi:hypothetical protein
MMMKIKMAFIGIDATYKSAKGMAQSLEYRVVVL